MLLIVETITWKPHIETAMDIAIQYRDAGTSVSYHNLRTGLPVCEDYKPTHKFLDLPSIRIRRSHDILSTEREIEHSVYRFLATERQWGKTQALALSRALRSTEEFLDIRYDAFDDIGWAALSSAVSMYRNSTITYPRHRKLLCRLVASGIMVYEKTLQLLREVQPDTVLLFNGRFATTRPVLRAVEKVGLPWLIHERGCDKHHYWIYDYLPQDTDARQNEIKSYWRPELKDAAHNFFIDRRNRVERDWHSYTKHQQPGKLPSGLNTAHDWVTFFTSSDDEMVAVGPKFKNRAFPTQLDALATVATAVGQIPNSRLCIRVHPHIARKSRADRQNWATLKLPGAFIVGPDEDIDSYALLEHSKVVCTYGSTIGIEATYWRRPSLLLGRSAYDQLDVCYAAENATDITRFITAPTVYPLENTLPYGAYIQTFGIPHQHYHADTLHRGRIRGTYLDDTPTTRLARFIFRLAQREPV